MKCHEQDDPPAGSCYPCLENIVSKDSVWTSSTSSDFFYNAKLKMTWLLDLIVSASGGPRMTSPSYGCSERSFWLRTSLDHDLAPALNFSIWWGSLLWQSVVSPCILLRRSTTTTSHLDYFLRALTPNIRSHATEICMQSKVKFKSYKSSAKKLREIQTQIPPHPMCYENVNTYLHTCGHQKPGPGRTKIDCGSRYCRYSDSHPRSGCANCYKSCSQWLMQPRRVLAGTSPTVCWDCQHGQVA
ncbi:hypothetical protein R3P38DRAFT_1315639 [Favolaschia claudopus]|uniref:Uncharacterized protein n=1 Tax=Favolaschia claudopus TaxID=2862362 RepID=A0AAW0AX52_9AGAR